MINTEFESMMIFLNKLFCTSVLFNQSNLGSFLLHNSDKKEFDFTLHNQLSDSLYDLSKLLPEPLDSLWGKSKNCKFEEKIELEFQADGDNNIGAKFKHLSYLRANINEFKIKINKIGALMPKDMILIYGYFKNKLLGENALAKRL